MNTNYEQTENSASKVDRTLQFSDKVSKELIESFSPKEQRAFLNHVERELNNYYSCRITESEHELKNIMELRDQFQGKDVLNDLKNIQ